MAQITNDWTTVIPQLLAQGLITLRESIQLPRICNHAYEEMSGMQGSTVEVPVPAQVPVQRVQPNNTQPDTAGLTPGVRNIPVDEWHEAPFGLTDRDFHIIQNGTLPMQAREAVKSLANFVDGWFWQLAQRRAVVNGFHGTPGTTPFAIISGTGDQGSIDDFAQADAELTTAVAPMDDRCVVLHQYAAANLKQQRRFSDVSYRGGDATIVRGELGDAYGAKWLQSQNVPLIDSSPLSGYALASAAVAGAETIMVDGDTEPIPMGTVFTVAGHSGFYAVAADVAAPASNSTAVPVSIAPALRADVADDAAITTHDYRANLIMHRDFFAFVTKPLQNDQVMARQLGSIIESLVDPVSGLTLRLEVARQHKQTRFSYDILFGGDYLYPDFGRIIFG